MRGWLVTALLLGTLAPAAAGQTASEPETVEQPVFTLGDWWKYRLKGEISGEANSTVARRENITVNGTTWDVWRITADVRAAQLRRTPAFTDTFVEDKWVRVTDHARVRTFARSEDATQRTSYNPPQQEIVFPFEHGSTWASHSNVTREEQRSVFGIGRPDPEGPVKYNHERVVGKVVGKVRLTTVAGVFVTYLIEFGSHTAEAERYHRWYYAPEVCTNVLEEYYASATDVQPKATYELMEYRCTKPAPKLVETPDVEETPPPPTWLNGTKEPPRKKADKNWLPGFEVEGLVAALATLALVGRRPRKE